MLYLPDENTFLDPTIDHTAPKQLPPGAEGASVLIIGRAAGLQTVPFVKPSEHRDHWSFDLRAGQKTSGLDARWALRTGQFVVPLLDR